MICLHCGYCCQHLAVMIVNDPDKGIQEDNIVLHDGTQGPCKHLRGNTPGHFSCAVHNKPWYEETPCFSHIQIERSPNTPCRMGTYILGKAKKAIA